MAIITYSILKGLYSLIINEERTTEILERAIARAANEGDNQNLNNGYKLFLFKIII